MNCSSTSAFQRRDHQRGRIGILAAMWTSVALSTAIAQAQPNCWTQVFSTDLNTAIPSQLSGPGALTGVQGWNGLGPAGNRFAGTMLHNAATGDPQPPVRLTLTGLPPHNAVRLAFLFAMIDSWDGLGDANGPDSFNVMVDGLTVFSKVFAANGQSNYLPPNGVLLSTGSNLGFVGGQFFSNDQAFDMSREPAFLEIPHSSTTLTIDFFASGPIWQGANDESWAIDNLSVSTTRVSVSGSGCPGSGSLIPTLALGGCPIAGGTLTVSIAYGLGGATALIVIGTGQAAIPMGNGCTLWVNPVHAIVTAALNGSGPGTGGFNLQIPIPATLSGTFYLQAGILDPGAPQGLSGTSALAVSF